LATLAIPIYNLNMGSATDATPPEKKLSIAPGQGD